MQNIPVKLKEKCRLILDIQQPSISNKEIDEPAAKIKRTEYGRYYICPRSKDEKTESH